MEKVNIIIAQQQDDMHTSLVANHPNIVGWPVESSPKDINEKYNPKHWGYTLTNVDSAYKADSPTIMGYSEKFGEKAAISWIYMNVLALYGTSNNSDMFAANSIRIFCECFTPQVKEYKLSELMVFFARYKSGRYDKSFASFDTRRIGNAFFFEFLPERKKELEGIRKQTEAKERTEDRFNPPQGYTSLSFYQEIKRRAEAGDINAINLLKGKIQESE